MLVVEDYQDAREMYAAYLQFSGYDVAEASNGLRGDREDARADAGHHPDGSGAAEDGRLGGDPPAEVRRTHEAHPDRRVDRATRWRGTPKGARQAGCDSFVTKPCLPDALVVEIERMLAARRGEGGEKGHAEAGAAQAVG